MDSLTSLNSISDSPKSPMFQQEQGKLWLSVAAIRAANVTDNTINGGLTDYKKGNQTWLHKKDEKDGRRVWVAYDHLPKQTKNRLDDHYIDIYRVAATAQITALAATYIELDDIAYFLRLRVRKDGTGYTQSEAKGLATACGWLRMADAAIDAKVWKQGLKVSHNQFIDNKTPFMHWLAGVLKAAKLYGFKIGNGLILTAKVAEWRERGRECLVSKYFGNDSAAKLEQRHIDFAIVHYAQGKKSIQQVTDLLNAQFGLNVTRQAVEHHLDKPDNKRKYIAAREGYLQASKQTASYFSLATVPYCDALWLMDGSPLALFADDGNGVRKSKYSAVFIRDAKSGKVVGLAFGESETAQLVKNALRYAITQTGNLPNAVRYDGGSANTNKEIQTVLDNVSNYHFKTAPYKPTGKAAVEKLVDLLENLLKPFGNFAGGNITRRGTEKSFNPDTVAKMKKNGGLPTSEQTMVQMWAAVEVFNNTADKTNGTTPNERYKADTDSRRRKATTDIIAATFWDLRPREIRYEQGGITMQVGNQRIAYHVGTPMLEDLKFKEKHEGRKFFVRENPDNRQSIALFDDNDRFVSEAVLKHEFSLLPEHRVEGEGQAWALQRAQNDAYLKDGLQDLEAATDRLIAAEIPTQFDFMTLNKAAINRMEAVTQEGFLDLVQNPTKKRVKGTAAKSDPSVVPPKQADNSDDFSIMTVFGQ